MTTLRNLILAAAIALPAVPGAQAITNPPFCTSNAATGTCRFSCTAGSIIWVEVEGEGTVQGDAQCGDGHAHCGPVNARTCRDSGFASSDDVGGYCDLTNGREAHCYSLPVGPIN